MNASDRRNYWRANMGNRPGSDNAIRIDRGSGDVFADLGLAPTPEERVKIEIARLITRVIADRNLKQTDAAQLLGIDQAKVSAITRGRLGGFGIERLMRLLRRVGLDVSIKLEESKSEEGSVTIDSSYRGHREKILA